MPTPLLKIDFSGHRLGPGKIALLEFIVETGSISQAAKKMAMSYRRGWLLIDELNSMFGQSVVETSAGGSGGGGARVTTLGLKIIKLYREAEADTQKLVEKKFGALK
jgi:molybdate transport system regulatory protein